LGFLVRKYVYHLAALLCKACPLYLKLFRHRQKLVQVVVGDVDFTLKPTATFEGGRLNKINRSKDPRPVKAKLEANFNELANLNE
jgi:hypothetical protein